MNMSDTQDQETEIEMPKDKEVDTNINIQIEDKQDKSTFERAIIEAFKQFDPDECIMKLSIALDEIKYYVEDIKSSPSGSKYLLNKNLIDKLSRIIERKLFNVNIQISKLYDYLLDSSFFPLLSSNQDLLISFSNEILNLLDITQTTHIGKSLEKKCSCFLNYLLNDSKSNFDDEQKAVIQELLDSFPSRNSSNIFKTYQKTSDDIFALCKSSTIEDKLEGLLLLMDTFGETNSLEEQFDLLLEYCPQIIKAIIYQPNPEYRQVYYQLGNFIISLLFSSKYKIEALIQGEGNGNNNDKNNNNNKIRKPNIIYLIDTSVPNDNSEKNIKVVNDLTFLNESVFELTTQREALLKCENIISICNLIVNTLSIYDKFFDLQYVCYLILKRIYFSFPRFRHTIEDCLASTLINLCMFKDPNEIYNSIECKQFLHYLLNCEGEESLKMKIQHRIKSKPPNEIHMSLDEGIECNLSTVEYDKLNLNDINLRIGYPSLYTIDAGAQYESYIEVEEANSLVYIAFSNNSYDITFRLLKYINDNIDKGNNNTNLDLGKKDCFREVYAIEKVNCIELPMKYVLFIRSPGIYKIIYDNAYSWITSKTIKHRLSVLKPITPITIPSSFITTKQINLSEETKEQYLGNNDNNSINQKLGLVIKHEGRSRNVDFGVIQSKKESLIKDDQATLYIPILLTKNSIRIIKWEKDTLGNSLLHYTELLTKNNEKSDLESFESAIETYLINNHYLDEQSSIKTIYLNAFINEKSIAEANTIPMSNEDYIRLSIMKIGFYPGNLLVKYKQIKYSCIKISDCCIMSILQNKLMKGKTVNSLIHIHFDKRGAFSSLYSDGVIQDTVSGFFYDTSKEMPENMDNIIEFINKATIHFGMFELSISNSNIDPVVFKSCSQLIQEKMSKLDTKIALTIYDQEFIENVFKYSPLFFL